MNPWRLKRPTRPCSHSVTHDQRNPREIDTIFYRQTLQKHTPTHQAPGRPYHPPGRPVCLPHLFFHFHHLPPPISLRSLTKYLPHIPNTTTIHFPPPFHRSTFTTSCHPSRGAKNRKLDLLELEGGEKNEEEACIYLWSHQGAAGYDPWAILNSFFL